MGRSMGLGGGEGDTDSGARQEPGADPTGDQRAKDRDDGRTHIDSTSC